MSNICIDIENYIPEEISPIPIILLPFRFRLDLCGGDFDKAFPNSESSELIRNVETIINNYISQ